MPSYVLKSDDNNALYNGVFEVYDPNTNKTNLQTVICNQPFYSKNYLSQNFLTKNRLEFVSDEPYVSPIFCNFSYNKSNDSSTGYHALEVPDVGQLFDVFISVSDHPVKLYFNNNKDKFINIYKHSSGIIFNSVAPASIRVINTSCDTDYSIALLLSNQFANNNNLV